MAPVPAKPLSATARVAVSTEALSSSPLHIALGASTSSKPFPESSSPESSSPPSTPTADGNPMAAPPHAFIETTPFSSSKVVVDATTAAIVDDDAEAENNTTVTTDGHGAATPAIWRIEFRGVSKLVRWVSKRGPTTNSNKLPLDEHAKDEDKLAQNADLTRTTSTAPRKLRRPCRPSNSIANVDAAPDDDDDDGGAALGCFGGAIVTTNTTGNASNIVKRLSFRHAVPSSLSMTSSPTASRARASSRPLFVSASASASTPILLDIAADTEDARLGPVTEISARMSGPRPTAPRVSSRELEGVRRHAELRKDSDATQVTRDVDALVSKSNLPPHQEHGGPQQQQQQDGQFAAGAPVPLRKRKLSKPRRPHPDLSSRTVVGNAAKSSSMTLPLHENIRGSISSKPLTDLEPPSLSPASASHRPILPRSRCLGKSNQSQPAPGSTGSTPHLVPLQLPLSSPVPEAAAPAMLRPQSPAQVHKEMKRSKALFHLDDNGTDPVTPSRPWFEEDIIFGGPPTPPDTAREPCGEYGCARRFDGHDVDDPHMEGGLPPLPRLPRTRKGRRLSTVVTEIADDGDFLRELNRELALATRHAAINTYVPETSSPNNNGLLEEEGHKCVEVLPRRVTMSEHGHGIGRRPGVDTEMGSASASVQMHMSVSMATSVSVRPLHPYPPPGYEPSMETERLNMARKAMMCAREIVRTERSYFAHLCNAGEREISQRWSVASVFFEHLPHLIVASKVFNASLERDGSIWGVAASFVSCAPQLESALVNWSTVVGSVMISPDLSSTSSSSSSSPNSSPLSLTSPPLSPSSASSLSNAESSPARSSSLHSIFTGGRGGRATGQQLLSSLLMTAHPRSPGTVASEDGCHQISASSSISQPSRSLTHISRGGGYLTSWRRSSAPPAPRTHDGNGSSSASSTSAAARSGTRTSLPATKSLSSSSPAVPLVLPPKGLTLQDIAIMPTQRVVRYVMLYQDLLKLTPATSRSYPVVNEARACAVRIAKSCNEAQGNLGLVSPRA